VRSLWRGRERRRSGAWRTATNQLGKEADAREQRRAESVERLKERGDVDALLAFYRTLTTLLSALLPGLSPTSMKACRRAAAPPSP
jgi:hypothetical protein